MKLLDLFCGAGGAGTGYHRAGFDVTGVDIKPQPRFPFSFVQADALEYLRECGHCFDIIHASPPCQFYSGMKGFVYVKDGHPQLIEPIRELLKASGKPYVIENVERAPLIDCITLCGVMFGLKVYRHRKFESNLLLMQPPHPKHPEIMPPLGSGISASGYVSIGSGGIRGVKGAHKLRSDAMGIDWMNRYELSESIPPAFTEYIGRQLISNA